MKKILKVCAAMVVLAAITACEPGFDEDLYIDNQSGCDLIIDYGGGHRYMEQQGTCFVRNGETITIPYNGGVGCTDKESSEWGLRYFFWGDSVTFMDVDSFPLKTFYATDTTSDDSPYNYNSSHYMYEEKVARNGCPAYYTKHTYTLTEHQITPMPQ